MKLFASILSVYILALIALLCVDTPHDNNLVKMELTSHKTDTNHNDGKHCTPFCICDCCITPVIHQDNPICLDCEHYTYREYAEYSVSYIFTLFAHIWQPPKLS